MELTLDLSYLNEISDGDQEFINDVLCTFLEEMPKDMEQMNQALSANDVVSIGKIAHKTKSTLHTLGLFELKELALKIEQSAKVNHQLPDIPKWAKEFMDYILQVYPNVKSRL